jgi:UDP-N-acetylglucosamine 2-epimerase (hydrolysing)
MRFNYFSELMKHAAVLVGNSSAGVREAPFLGLPSLDVGTRQNRRASGSSITACAADDAGSIDTFLVNRWSKRFAANLSFGSGNTAQRFVSVLLTEAYWSRPVQKQFSE